ncbi:hypothetical protein EAH79_13930 [Sphingomonas koreensis]|nr:hypothetical protein EAH79_13930 [Sphingomonas koreensis]
MPPPSKMRPAPIVSPANAARPSANCPAVVKHPVAIQRVSSRAAITPPVNSTAPIARIASAPRRPMPFARSTIIRAFPGRSANPTGIGFRDEPRRFRI